MSTAAKSAVKSSRKPARKTAKKSAAKQPNAAARALAVIEAGRSTQAEALELFDALPAVELDFMFGEWQGSGVHTDHAMDGLLETYDWYGKAFLDADHVHPLLFKDGGGRIFRVNPALMPMGLALSQPWLKKPFMKHLFRLGKILLRTQKTTARLRMTEHRAKVSATMCYDALPIHDVFRKVDANTVLGLMDFKGMAEPFFFALRKAQP